MTVISRIRQKIRRGEFVHSTHLLVDKLPKFKWTIKDVKNGILTGELYQTLTKDDRGTRYVILGQDLNGYEIFIVCRFRDDGNLFIITAYEEYA